MVRRLVEEGDEAAVLSVVRRLDVEIKKLHVDLVGAREGPGRHSERLTSDQLVFAELKMARQIAEERDVVAQDEEDSLADEGALGEEMKKRAPKPKAPPSPRKRREPPVSLPRVDNLLPVPDARDCPDCHAPTCHAPMVELPPEVTEAESGRRFFGGTTSTEAPFTPRSRC